MPTTSRTSQPQRHFKPVCERLLIIGLDGATFNVLGPLMQDGFMPRLREIVESGTSGTLYSTVPPITPAAWTTFLTGKQPGVHRILDFEGYDVTSGRLTFNSSQRVGHVRNIWQILSDRDFKVGSVNVPLTYPPFTVNGFVISGFDTPNAKADFAYPAELKSWILERWSDPTLGANWERRIGGGEELFLKNLGYISNSFHQGTAMSRALGERFGWDVLMVVFKLVDNLQHKTWKYLDPRWSQRNPKRSAHVRDCFRELDKAVGDLAAYARNHGASVMMVSDHGHGSLEGKVFPNRLLTNWGYLKLRDPISRIGTALQRRKRRHAMVNQIEEHIPVDMSRTRACIMHAGNAGFLYINLKGRQPGGIVEPDDYEKLRSELSARFLGPECQVQNPAGQNIPLFPEVYQPEQLYGCSRESEPWMPDLILIQHETLAVVRRMRGSSVVQWMPYDRLEGTHRKEGIFIAAGPGIAHGAHLSASLVDCAPTILASLGLPIPRDMPGRVIGEIFERPPTIETRSAEDLSAGSPAEEHAYTEEQLKQVTERLADLGYME